MFTSLSNIASVSLGYKSLQNNFFYVNKPTVDTYGIENRFLTPIYKVSNFDSTLFWQKPKVSVWLFNCADKKSDLRGTGALKYIDAMANRAATDKKQTGKSKTIKEALEAQSGGTWYAPKAKPNKHHIWLRKAIHGTFSPYLFKEESLVDQRCNSIKPIGDMNWELVAAAITSSLFAYSMEVNGSAGMGAGALEAATINLRSYPVFDVRVLNKKECISLMKLGRAVWDKDKPVDWSSGERPGKALQALDEWVLQRLRKNVKLEDVYNDIADVCRSRILVAKDKTKKTKKKHSESIGSVAESIAKTVRIELELRNFPDDFVDGNTLDIDFNFDTKSLQTITISHFFEKQDVLITNKNGEQILDENYPNSVAEALIRALLLGRFSFAISSDTKVMKTANSQFMKWISAIDAKIAKAIGDSAVGTGYEDELRTAIYSKLGVNPLSGQKQLPTEINLNIEKG